MMESVYAQGITVVQVVQKRFLRYEELLMMFNHLADPSYSTSLLFPIISVIDSVFAAEFILVTSVGNWINVMLKWLLAEHRPFWWVKETRHYGPMRDNKPYLRLGPLTCETGPGCPSGHVMNITSVLLLLCVWIGAIVATTHTLKSIKYQKYIKYGSTLLIIFFAMVTSVSRMYIAAHFPHQCLLGLIFGVLVTHFVSNFWVGPFMNLDEKMDRKFPGLFKRTVKKHVFYNILMIVLMVALSFANYWGQKLIGVDPSWSVKFAFKWCPSPDYLHYNTTPFFSLVESIGSMLGWAICVTPGIKEYRYNSKRRSLPVAAIATIIAQQIFSQWEQSISKDSANYFYFINFFMFALRPFFFLRVIPFIATLGQGARSEIIHRRVIPVADETETLADGGPEETLADQDAQVSPTDEAQKEKAE